MTAQRKLKSGLWGLIGSLSLLGLLVQLRPEVLLLASPVVQVDSPYCSRWKAFQDYAVKQRQDQGAAEVMRQMRWQRKDGALELWATPEGPYWAPVGSGSTLAALIAQQQREIYGRLQPGETVIDCGAHVGTFVRHALLGGAGRVIAVEPSSDAGECLRRNFESEIAAGRVTLVAKGIWDREQTLKFFVNGNGDAANSFVVHNRDSREVAMPVTSIDLLVKELGLARVNLIKADVKGATARMLDGARATLRRDKPRLALSTEEPPEDPAALTTSIGRMDPSYKATCGPCLTVNGLIRTDVMFYR